MTSTLVEGLKELLAALEAGELVAAGEISNRLMGLAVGEGELEEARALHQQCETLSEQHYATLQESMNATGKARRATGAYHELR